MKTHELKTDPHVFELSLNGLKNYEIRFDDRGFNVGDILLLKETKYSDKQMKRGKPLFFTGRTLTKKVNSIFIGYGLQNGWVILNVEDV